MNLPQYNTCGLYRIINIQNGKFYIGSSKCMRSRFKEHIGNLNKNEHENNRLQNAWNKYGEKNFEFEIIELCSEEDLLTKEQGLLDRTNCCDRSIGYDIAKFATSPMRGRKHTKESIEKMSECKKGKKHSEEFKKELSKRMKGRVFSKESIAKMRAAQAGRNPNTEEHKKKVRAAHLGRKHTPETIEKMKLAHKNMSEEKKLARNKKISEKLQKFFKDKE